MSTAVPVVPNLANLLDNEKELSQLLLACQESSISQGTFAIVSFSQKIEPVDPLAILSAIAPSYPLHFYWENKRQEEAILGYGVTTSFIPNSSDRFLEARKFIESCRHKIIKINNFLESAPYLFCSFSFFDSTRTPSNPFPSARVILPQFQIIRKKTEYFLVVNLLVDSGINLNRVLEQIDDTLQLFRYHEHLTSLSKNSSQLISKNQTNHKIYPSYNFKFAVTSALQSIQSKQFSKIVLAHALDVISPTSFQIVECLNNLRNRHPDCYIFSISNGKGYHFIGASPERLISVHNHQLVTDALAGSAPRGKTPSEDAFLAQKLLRSEKERREHQAVSEFITQRLLQLGLKPQCSPLKLLKLSNIQHIWTPIYAQLSTNIHPLEIVSKLHPTPAVAGVPTEIACEQIRHYETFDRSLYAAPLGWVDFQGNSEFVVGIRSALIKDNHARLYAGAGIVAGSDPNKELAEIQLKFQALLKALL